MKTLIPAYCQVMKFGGALIWGDFENKQNYKLKCQCTLIPYTTNTYK